jgi:zinc-binding alcohol dehydrogenase/oxidoreductase
MKALILHEVNQALSYEDHVIDPIPQKGDGLVEIAAAALNHRDLFITQGKYAGMQLPIILGSDGVGTYRGKRVLLYPALEWGKDKAVQGKSFRVLGMPDQGTFAERIAVPKANIFAAPEHLSLEEAAALPLAALTAWRTLFTRCALKKGEKVFITGIGGGVALAALQFAVKAGASVWVSSGSEDKIKKAIALGAKGGINYNAPDWDKAIKQEAGGFDIIVDAAAGDGFARYPGICNPAARIGVYGATLGKVNNLLIQPIFWKQISVLGSTMGSPLEFKAMLKFVEKHEIKPVVDAVFPFQKANEALAYMAEGKQFGKIVLRQKK